MSTPLWQPASTDEWLALLHGNDVVITLLDSEMIVQNQFNVGSFPALAHEAGQRFLATAPDAAQALLYRTAQKVQTTGETTTLEIEGPQQARYSHRVVRLATERPLLALYSSAIPYEKPTLSSDEPLRRIERRYRAIFDYASDGIMIAERREEVPTLLWQIEANPVSFDILGYTVEEIRATDIRQIYTAEDIESSRQRLEKLEYHKLVERKAFRKDGSEVTVESMVVPVYGDQGEIVEYVTFFRDISERKQREQDLHEAITAAQQANEAKDRFIANISHELRTPLNAIMGFAGILESANGLSAQSRGFLQYIRTSGQDLAHLIDELLDVSRLDLNQFRLDPRVFDFYELIQRVAETAQRLAHPKHLAFQVTLAPEVPRWIEADASRLRQIITNLVDNAIKYTETGSVHLHITPDTRNTSDRLHIQVVDTGIGLPGDEAGNIFEAFTTGGHVRKQTPGIGLGLYITHSLVQLMEGTMTAANRPTGGSVFDVMLPLHRAAPQIAAVDSTIDIANWKAAHAENYRILIVDDVEANATLFAQWLSDWGFPVEVVLDSNNAMARARAWQPHLVLLDLYMNGKSGFELAKQFRADKLLRNTSLVAVTASALPSDRNRARTAGCDEVLVKPIQPREVAQILATLLEIPFVHNPVQQSRHAPDPLSPTTLVSLPSEWRTRLYQAAVAALPNQALDIVAEIDDAHPVTATTLRNLIRMFRLVDIIDSLESTFDMDES